MTDFIGTIVSMKDGEVAMDISRKFTELIESVRGTRKKGKLTLVLDIVPAGVSKIDGSVTEVTISHDCKVAKPELGFASSVFFIASENALVRDNPAQTKLFEEETERKRG